MNKKVLGIIGAVVILVVSYLTYEHFTYVKTDNAQIEAHTVMLAAKVSGFITKVNVEEGQNVKAGDVLVEIDGRDYQNALTQAKAQLTSVDAKMKDAERTFGRISDLYKKEAVSQQQFDQSSTTFAEVRSSHDAISAQVAQSELNLSNTKIVAPMSGMVARKSAEVGQLAAPGVALVGFVGADERWITANFKETEIEGIKVGAKVDIAVDAIGGRKFKGLVESISASTGARFTLIPPDNATGNFTKVVQRVPVRIKFESLTADDIQVLRAGLSADVSVHKH
jgi:membrane fusion protein (multidrug efflux system)